MPVAEDARLCYFPQLFEDGYVSTNFGGGVYLCERVLLALNAMTSPFYAFNSMVVTGVIQIVPIFSGTPDRKEQTQMHK